MTDLDVSRLGGWVDGMGIRMVSATRDEVVCEIDVAPVHHQAYGVVHGGVYCGLIETVCSVGAAVDAAARGQGVVGLENNTSFVRATRSGRLRAVATPVTRGRRSQLWQARVEDEEGRTVALGRVRLLAIDPGSTLGGEAFGQIPS